MLQYFYNGTIRRTVIAFGTIFNNIELRDFDENGVEQVREKVPLAYGPRDKFLARLEDLGDINKQVQITLPRIYFEMNSYTYDPQRKTSPVSVYKKTDDATGGVRSQYMPVPYNIGFELGILAKSQDDGLGILEQILPYFQPSFNLPIKMIPDMDEIKDCPVILNNVDYTDTYDGSFLNRRYLEYRMQFTVKTYLYGPVTNIGVIKKSIAEIGTLGDTTRRKDTRLTYTPKALEDKNADGNIDALDDALVQPDDNFGFNEGFEFL